MSKPLSALCAILLAAVLAAPAVPASAQQGGGGSLTLQLDSLAPAGAACRVTLVAANGLGGDIAKVAYEFVFFDRDGRVELLTVLDLRDLPAGRTRVRQFDLPGIDCAGVSRLLVNDAKACDGAGIDAGACLARLETTSKAGIPLER